MIDGQQPLHYRLELKETADSTGFFAAVPDAPLAFEQSLDYLRRHPNDAFMYAYLLGEAGAMQASGISAILRSGRGRDPLVRTLLLEAATIHRHLDEIKGHFKPSEKAQLVNRSPLVFLRSAALPDQALHRQWAGLFKDNLLRHRPLPAVQQTGLRPLFEGLDGGDPPQPETSHLRAVLNRCRQRYRGSPSPRPFLEETIHRAMERLGGLDLFDGPEMRHQASLSLYALLRRWRFLHEVQSGSLHYRIGSIQTSYGRGLSLAAARASCLMEVVERCASFASFDASGVVGTREPHPLKRGPRSQLLAEGLAPIDPNGLGLEVPYRDEPLYWIEGEQVTVDGRRSVWVPAQSVFLFCNLDERALFSGLGSTGLASGNTLAEAKLSALYELIERDSQAVHPFHPSRCFRIYSDDQQVRALLDDYRARGIHLQFQDISPHFGIPCCTCFVTHRDGTVAKGGGANLNGKRAVLSALTETPYPYPVGPPSAPALPDLPWLQFETLPDFSTGTADFDLFVVEETLLANGYSPIYLDITRKDVGIPVVKALLPGFELLADFDATSRISPRLFSNYLKTHKKQ